MTSHKESEYDNSLDSLSEDDNTESASEYNNTDCVSEDDSTKSVSENNSMRNLGDDSTKQNSIVSSSLRKQSAPDTKDHEPSHSRAETSRHMTWIGWVESTLQSHTASVQDKCSIDATSDEQRRNNTTVSVTNKRARSIESNGSYRGKAKTARHQGPSDMTEASLIRQRTCRSRHHSD